MRKVYVVSLVIVGMLFMQAAPVMAWQGGQEENLIVNPGFESGGVNNWSVWQISDTVSDKESYSGDYSADISLSGGVEFGGLVQDIAYKGMSPGDSFEASVWIKTVELHNTNAVLKMEFFDDTWTATGDAAESKIIGGDTDWTKVSISGTVPAQTTKVNFILGLWNWGAAEDGKAYFDDAFCRPSLAR